MKQNRLTTLLAAGAVSAIALTTAFAQTSATTTTTTNPAVTTSSSSTTTTSTSSLDGTGTITTYTPGSEYFSVRTTSSTEPVRYYYNPKETVLEARSSWTEMYVMLGLGIGFLLLPVLLWAFRKRIDPVRYA